MRHGAAGRAVKHCPGRPDGLILAPCAIVEPCQHPAQVITTGTAELNVQGEILRWLELI